MFPAPAATQAPDFDVIADVSLTLATLLTDGLRVIAPQLSAELHDLQGTIPTSPARLTLSLFEVVEDPSARNRPRPRLLGSNTIDTWKPPMTLLLRYMMTPWSGDRATDHRILGRTLQILYDDAIIHGPALQGGLAGRAEALKVSLAPLSLEDRSRVWYAVQKPYRLSLTYEVRVVNLRSTVVTHDRPVTTRDLGFGSRVDDEVMP